MSLNRRSFVATTVAALASRSLFADAADLKTLNAEIEKRHGEAVQRLQEWIRQPSIAAENRGMNEGCELMMRLLRDAGFTGVTKVPTDGQPGVLDRKSTRLNSSHMSISYAVFCLKKKTRR